MKKIELSTIQNGAVFDLFNEELQKVLSNIDDVNTEAVAERSITIKLTIRPDKARRTGEVKLQCFSSIAKAKPIETFMFFDRDEKGKFAAYLDDPGPELPGLETETGVVRFPNASNK